MSIIYPQGTSAFINVDSPNKIAIFSTGKFDVYYRLNQASASPTPYKAGSYTSTEVVLTPGSSVNQVQIVAYAEQVVYSVGANPSIVGLVPDSIYSPLSATTVLNPGFGYQGAAVAKTAAATLTAAELNARIITIDSGATGAVDLQLPLATAMDGLVVNPRTGLSFDFHVVNLSTTSSDDATITTNTGWTLVQSMVVYANDAGTARSVGTFRAQKTGAGWTLTRIA